MSDSFIEHSFTCMVEKVSKYAIFLLDPDGIVLTWNPAAAMRGYQKEEIIGRHFAILYTEDARRDDHPRHNLAKAAKHGTFEEEAWRIRKDGTLIWALVEIIAIKAADGTLTSWRQSSPQSRPGKPCCALLNIFCG